MRRMDEVTDRRGTWPVGRSAWRCGPLLALLTLLGGCGATQFQVQSEIPEPL